MPIEDVVNVNVDVSSQGLTEENFGIPLLACYHTVSGDLVQAYSSLREAEDAGFTAALQPLANKMLKAAFQQKKKPKQVKIGKRSAWAQVIRLTPSTPSLGVVYSVTIDGSIATVTADGDDDVDAICDKLVTEINALNLSPSDVTAAPSGATATHLDVTGASGVFHTYEVSSTLKITDVTSTTSVDDDLSAFESFDDAFYGVAIDVSNETDIKGAAAWCESRRKIFSARTHDGDVWSSSTTDVVSDLKALLTVRTHVLARRKIGGFGDVGLLAMRLTATPGSDTWALKEIRADVADKFSTTEINYMKAKNCNYYIAIKDESITQNGKTTEGEYMDIVRGIDWLVVRMQERIFAFLKSNEKVGYDDTGIEGIRSCVLAQLQAGVEARLLQAEPAPTCEVPKFADTSSADRLARLVSGITFGGQLRDAIHAVDINGALTH